MNQTIQGSDPPGRPGAAQRDMRQLLVVAVRRHWLSILGISLLFSFFVGLYSITRPRKYQASATVVPPLSLQKERLGGKGGLGGGAALMEQLLSGAGVSSLYAEVVRSRVVADVLIDRFELQKVYGVSSRSKVREELGRMTSVDLKENGAVKIAVKDLDPNLASAMANTYVEELGRITKGFRTAEARMKKEFLESRVAEIQKELAGIQDMPSDQARMKELLFEMLSREYEMARMEEAWNMPTVQVLDPAVPPEIPVTRGSLSKCSVAGILSLVFMTYFWIMREGRLLQTKPHCG